MNYYKDADSTETQEWLAAFESVVKHADKDRKGKHHVGHIGEHHIQWALRLDGEWRGPSDARGFSSRALAPNG